MPRNGSGVYTLPAGNPVVPGTTIDAAWANSTLEDMANEITNSLSRTGAGGMIAPFRIADGNVTAPGLSFLNETSSGFYRAGTGTITWAIQGVPVATFSTTGLSVPAGKTLAAGGNATVGGNLAVTGTISSTGGVFNTTIDSITNKVGADHVHFKVKATQTLVKGDVVKVTGYNVGDAAFEVAKVSSATDVAVGVVYANIANGALGAVVNTGLLENVDTSAFSAGQILYPNASGGLTATKPSSGQYQAIAFVLRSNANNGAILIEASEPLYVQASTNTGNTLVLRDGSGNFSAGTITASLTGNVTGNVSGNAGTVTNGVYTTGSYSDPSWLVSLAGSKVSGNISGNAANVTGTVAIANGGTGATTAGAARTALDVPTRTGGDASGTWGISITGNAANVTGTVAVANGGTGSTTASGARTNLGLVIGTDVPSPTGTGASGTWGINITGNAATVTNGVVTTGSYSDPSWITALAGSKITGNISGNAANVTGTVAVANGGTGATSASGARVNLLPSYTSNELKALRVNAAGTDVEWFTVSAGGDVAGPASATDNALVRFDATTGKLIQNSVGILSDTGDLSGIAALSMSGALTLSGGTANGVAYLNGSKVLTTGSALTFDGTKLGVGVASPVRRLDVSGQMRATSSTVFAEIDADSATGVGYLGTASNHPIGFKLNDAEVGRWTSTGLGIGTSSPAFRLDVGGGDGTNIALRSTGTSAARFRAYVNGAESGVIGFLNGGGQFFEVAGSEQMRLTSTGLGIGTSSPGQKLEIQAPAGASQNATIRLRATDSGGSASSVADIAAIGTGGQVSALAFSTRDGTNILERLRLDGAGNLGLGVTPSAWGSNWKAIQVNGLYGGALSTSASSNTSTNLSHSAYHNGTNWIYGYTGVGAARYEIDGPSGGATHKWYTAPSGTAGNAISFTQAMTLNASGNLGLGVTSPTLSFEVGQNTAKGYMHSGVGVFSVGTSTNHPYTFDINGTERARITSGGVLLVGTTSAPSIAGVTTDHAFVAGTGGRWVTGFRNTTTGTPWGLAVEYSGAAPNDTSSNFLYCYDSAPALRMSVRSNGGIANYQANDVNLSDRREKTNFAPAKSYLDTICAIPVQTFNYIDQNMEDDPGATLGVVAQDVQAVAPELVMESNWGTEEEPKMRLSIYQTDLQYALMKCIQEQQAIITDLRARVAALEAA